MKPIYLEFCGINSFSETAQIDFRALLSGGVFGIFGNTGSGKSTILDSIHFALYGEIDRVPKSFNDCINYRSESATVTFDFEISVDGARRSYRVKRERKRKTGATKAYLYEYTDEGGLLALAEGTRDVDAAVEKLLGLSFTDFKTCIALPQGDFAALVKSTTSERVKLVSRLFNLEKYGERLSKAVNERYTQADEEVRLIQAKMGENEGNSDETICLQEEKIQKGKQALISLQAAYAQAEKDYAAAKETQKAKADYDALCQRIEKLNNRLTEMQTVRDELAALPKAQRVRETAQALSALQADERAAQEKLTLAQTSYSRAVATEQTAAATLEKENYDERILRLTVDLQRVKDAKADVDAAKTAKAALDECIAKYSVLKNKCPAEDFAAARQKLEGEIQALGEDGTLLDYLKRNYKGVLLTDVYGEIRADLTALAEKYPIVQSDVSSLVKKYSTIEASGDSFDIATINLAFKEIERKRKALREKLDETEKRRLAFEENESKKQLLVEQGKILRENYLAATEKIALIKDLGTETELTSRMETLRSARQKAKDAYENAQAQKHAAFAETEKYSSLLSAQKSLREKQESALATALSETGFASVRDAERLLVSIGNAEEKAAENKAFFEEYALLLREYEKADKTRFENYDESKTSVCAERKAQAQAALDECNKTLGADEKELARVKALREKYKEQEKELAAKEKYRNLCDELRSLVRSNKFLEFIASEYLQEICSAASKTLLSLTGGRYFLRYDKEFKVGDNLDGGNLRAVKTLSGGETFLVSLSLALSLSAAICMKSLRPIEFFFLDEGFGTLDGALVDTVMDVLGKLSRTFSVGLISHVEELKHRIDHKIVVTGANENHGSKVKVECF